MTVLRRMKDKQRSVTYCGIASGHAVIAASIRTTQREAMVDYWNAVAPAEGVEACTRQAFEARFPSARPVWINLEYWA